MFKKVIGTSATPHIIVDECQGNLGVRGIGERQIVLHGRVEQSDSALSSEGDTITLTSHSDCRLLCPEGASLTIRSVHGELKVDGVVGALAIGTIHGRVSLRSVGPVTLEETFGHLTARAVMGDLQAESVSGYARVHRVAGLLALGRVEGRLIADELHGGLAAGQVEGHVRLGPPFSPGATYRLTTSGHLRVDVPADASLRLTIRADGSVRSNVPGLDLEQAEGETTGVLGAGEAVLEADVRDEGHVRLRQAESEQEMAFDFAADLEGMGAEIGAQVAEVMGEMEVRLEEALSRIDSAEIGARVEQAVEKGRRSVWQAVDRERKLADRAAEQARIRAERAERRWRRASGRRPQPRREQATDEERLRVLRMVEAGQIDPEQAVDLLAALGGR